MELTAILDDLIKHANQAYDRHCTTAAEDPQLSQTELHKHTMLLQAARLIRSVMRRG